MPLPIRKVKEELRENQLNQNFDMDFLNQFLDMSPFVLFSVGTNPAEKKAIKDLWLHSESLDNDKVKIGSSISEQDISMLRSKGYIEGSGDVISFTDTGKKLL